MGREQDNYSIWGPAKIAESEFGELEPLLKHHPERRGLALVIPWSRVSDILSVVTLSAVGALIVVATVTRADVLSSVALVLAILSFAAQLIVTAAQSASGNDQYRQMTRLYEQSNAVLAKIRSQSDSLLANQKDQFDKVLDHVLTPSVIRSAVSEVTGDEAGDDGPNDSGNESSTRDDISAERVARVLRDEVSKALAGQLPAPTPPARLPQAEANERELAQFPTEDEGADVLSKFVSLSDPAKRYIHNLVSGGTSQRPQRPRFGHRRIVGTIETIRPSLRELAAAGFVTLEPGRSGDRDVVVMAPTSLASTAVRFFTGQGIIPQYLREFLASERAQEESA